MFYLLTIFIAMEDRWYGDREIVDMIIVQIYKSLPKWAKYCKLPQDNH